LRTFNGDWRVVKQIDAPIDQPSLLGLGRDGASIAVSFPEGNTEVVRELLPNGATWSDPIAAPEEFIRDPVTQRPIGQILVAGGEWRYEFFDPRDQRAWTAMQAAYPNDLLSLVSFSADHRKLVLRVDSATEGPAYALVNLDTGKGDWIANEYRDLAPRDIGPKHAIAFKAADGVNLTGYLTLPQGRQAKGLPVNYRGSDGFGWDFQASGFGQWGRKMQTDPSDGVRYLAAQGTIDPARGCIAGASYGGYAALAGAALDPGVYRCAASVAGLSDLKRFVAGRRRDDGVGNERYWLRYMGPSSDLAAVSPALQVEKVKIPILLIHGKDDTTAPFEQSQIMADALRKAGKHFEFVTLKKEDHWLSQGETRLLTLQSVVACLEKNNPPN
jgi:dipeptidyl aminopeptidase/acylaminoacyl peptidase